MTNLIVSSIPSDLVRQAADWLEAEIAGAIAAQGCCAVGLSGGRTPEPVYRKLALASRIDWQRVDVFFGDERAVPPDHPESNYFMVHQALLSHVPIPSSQVHRMEAERPDREAAAVDSERSLPAALDLLLLGMGSDGHTASLFPGSPVLDEQHRLVLPVEAAQPPVHRLTITPPVIRAARKLAVIATGEDKAAMVARALEGPLEAKAVPVQLARHGTWFLDQAAAAQLRAGRVAP